MRMMIKSYRAGLANLVLALLVGGPTAPEVASPTIATAAQPAAPVVAAPAAAVYDDAPPLC
jgi:hypothetical protein